MLQLTTTGRLFLVCTCIICRGTGADTTLFSYSLFVIRLIDPLPKRSVILVLAVIVIQTASMMKEAISRHEINMWSTISCCEVLHSACIIRQYLDTLWTKSFFVSPGALLFLKHQATEEKWTFHCHNPLATRHDYPLHSLRMQKIRCFVVGELVLLCCREWRCSEPELQQLKPDVRCGDHMKDMIRITRFCSALRWSPSNWKLCEYHKWV